MSGPTKTKAQLLKELQTLRSRSACQKAPLQTPRDRESLPVLRNLFARMKEGMAFHEVVYSKKGKAVDYRIIDINPAYEKITGLKRKNAIGKLASELYGTGKPPYLEAFTGVCVTGKAARLDTYFPPMKMHFSISIFPYQKHRFITLFQDVTEQVTSRRKIEHLNSVLRGIRNVNQLITHEKNPEVLLQTSCRLLTESRGYGSAWILSLDSDKKPVAFYSAGLGGKRKIMSETLMAGNTLSCFKTALADKAVFTISGKNRSCRQCPLYEKTHNAGAFAVQVAYQETIYGVLTVSVPSESSDIKEEKSLIREVADDIGFALHTIRVEKAVTSVNALHRASEARFRTIFETSPAGILIAEIKSARLIYANPAIGAMLGYTPAELVGKPYSFIHPAKEFSAAKKIVDDQLKKGSGPVTNIPCRRKDGSVFFVDVNLSLAKIDDVACRVGFFTDISQRRCMEKTLLENESRLRSLFENMHSAAAVYRAIDAGRDFIFVDFNRAGERIEKIKRGDLIGKRVTEVFPGVKDFGLLGVFRRVWKTGHAEAFPVGFCTDNRIEGWRDNFVYRLDSGEIVALYTDETKNQRAREELRSSANHLKALLENTSDFIMIADAAGKAIMFNNAYAAMIKKTLGLIMKSGLAPHTLAEDPDALCLWERLHARILKGEKFTVDISYPVGKTPRHFEFSFNPIKEKGEVIGFCEVGRDITGRKAAEETLKQNIREMTVFNAIARDVSISLSLDQVVDAALDGITNVIKPDMTVLFLRKGEDLLLLGERHRRECYRHDGASVHRVGQCLCGSGVLKKKALYSEDISQDPRCTMTECKKAGLRSFAALPLTSGDTVIGVLGLASAGPRRFEDQHRFLETMSNEIAIGLYNAVLYEQVRDYTITLEQEVAERKRASEELKALVEEKQVLLRELYHRTKNNMQVICSMMALRSLNTSNEEMKRILQELENRIHSMALVHQKLYQSQNLSRIDLKDYIEDLMDYLHSSYGEKAEKINFSVHAQMAPVLIDTAIPCGMLITELVSNAMKYAFPGGQSGAITVSVNALPDTIEIIVADNGFGVSPGFNFRTDASMGLNIVINVVEQQLRGSIDFETKVGVTCRIRFADNAYLEYIQK